LAEELARRSGVPRLSMDETRARILPDSTHNRADRAAAYRANLWAASLLLPRGISVILDATFSHREDRAGVVELCHSTGSPLYLVECRVDQETALRRFEARDPGPRLDLTAARARRLVSAYPYTSAGLVLDTATTGFDSCMAAVADYLKQGGLKPDAKAAWLV
jgi:predicted kinase